eukprot:9690805-Prorocentrum_lima.AAC.1
MEKWEKKERWAQGFIHWSIGRRDGLALGKVVQLEAGMIRPVMGYPQGTFAHVVAILRAQIIL